MYIIKHDNAVYFAIPPLTVSSRNCTDDGLAFSKDNALIWKAPNDDDILVMADSNNIVTDAIRNDPEFFSGELTYDRMVLEFLPKLKKAFASYDKLNEDGMLPWGIALAQRDRAFVIGYDCDEVFDFLSLHGDVETSALRLSQGLEPDERFKLVKQMLEINFPAKKYPLLVMDTKTFTPRIIE